MIRTLIRAVGVVGRRAGVDARGDPICSSPVEVVTAHVLPAAQVRVLKAALACRRACAVTHCDVIQSDVALPTDTAAPLKHDLSRETGVRGITDWLTD